ncbi:MAG: tRNA (guanosine(46)-N7)-methyltransferase TrmB [Xanthomonadales bacterium]|nr:tRNA (guanosine(46)-N7)-methyltransferase TrmB [Xanthomonadales bacterium]
MVNVSTEQQKSRNADESRRHVRSFVLRAGRLTEGQKRALNELWPLYGIAEAPEPLDLEAIFSNDHPVIMEIGFGNGEATWQMAAARPDENFLAVEVHKPGIGHLLLKIEEHGLANVRIAREDAVELLRHRILSRTLAGVRIYFPDPWPKKRHHKRRLIQPPFIALLAEKMQSGGILHLATDWEPYSEHILEVMHNSGDFENFAPDGGAVPKPEWRPATKYEKRGERLGHGVFDLVFRRIA